MGNIPVNCSWMEEAARETLSPVGIYFSPKTRNYFSGVWIEAYMGIFNLLLREHIEFEIVTPRTLGTAMSNLLILPDVKCVSDEEYSQFELWLKNGKTLIFTGETGYYNDKREISMNRNRMQKLSQTYPNAIRIIGDPGRTYYHFLKANFNQAVHKGEYPAFESNELNQLLGQIRNIKVYSPAIIIENADVCVTQIASVDSKPTIFLANFSGLKGSENANPFPDKEINVTFNKAKQDAQVIFIPFPGKAQEFHGVWKNGSLQVTLPEISRGAIVQLNCKSRIPYFHVPRCENGCE